jgi:hypothetical protein
MQKMMLTDFQTRAGSFAGFALGFQSGALGRDRN